MNGISQPFFFQGMKCEASDAVDDIGGADVGGEFLVDPLEQPLRAGALDLHGDAGIGRLERLAELFADRQIHRGIEDDPAFLLRGVDQFRRDRLPAAAQPPAAGDANTLPSARATDPFSRAPKKFPSGKFRSRHRGALLLFIG